MIVIICWCSVAAVILGALVSLPGRSWRTGPGIQAIGAAGLGVSGFAQLADSHCAGSAFTSQLAPRIGLDPLSGLFLGTLGLVAVPALAYSARYLQGARRDRVVAALTGGFVLTMAGLIVARDPVTFLAFWELMTLLPAAIILVSRSADRMSRRTVLVYLGITHLGGAATWVCVLLLASAGAFGSPGRVAVGSALQIGIAVTALVGMGTKAGVVPLHSWLPRAHPIAPAPVSALMSGVMIKLPVYVMIRVFVDWLGVLPSWFGVLVLTLGGLSAVGGVLYALFQHELKRLLALHSIENIGIIVLGLGACLLLRAAHAEDWAGLALAAALLHTVNHAVFKSQLFLGAGAFEHAAGSLDLGRLGGLLRRLPWTGGAFLVAAMAIAGLPPLNGFASEWLTLQGLLHVTMGGRVAVGLSGAVGLAALGATAALAVFCFVKVAGLVLLGQPRSLGALDATEVAWPMRGAAIGLASVCVVLGLAPGLLVRYLVTLAPWAVSVPAGTGLQLPATGGLPTLTIGLTLAVLTAGLVLLRGQRSAATEPTWVCGQPVTPALSWSGAGFTKPLRLVLERVLRPRREITVQLSGAIVTEVSYDAAVPDLIDDHLYRPVTRRALAAARRVRRLQSGSLGVYVAYLTALVVAILVIAHAGLLR